jgi:ribosomal protein L37E
VTVSCPDCGAPVDPNRDQLCPQCGYPLMFLRERPAGGDTQQFGVARAPGERDAPGPAAHPILLEPVPPAPQPGLSEIGCPACHEINPATRIRCQRCGQELRPAQPGPVDLGPLPKPKRSYTWLAVLAAVVAVVAIVGVVALVIFRDRDEPTAQPSGPTALIRVDSSAVTVTASAADPDTALWGPQLANDGDLTTAWHSGGHLIATNVGVEVRFAFNRPVKLARITMVNGYAKSPVDYTNNQRVTKMRIRTDKGEREVPVVDSADPQTFDLDGAATKTVTLVVLATVPGTKFKDVCISEAMFDERV